MAEKLQVVSNKTVNQVVGFLISEDRRWVALTAKNAGVHAVASPDDKSPRATMARAFLKQAGVVILEDKLTMFAEYLNPFENLRIVYFFAVVECEPFKKSDVRWCSSNMTHLIDIPRDLLWLIPIALNWDEALLENVVMLRKRLR